MSGTNRQEQGDTGGGAPPKAPEELSVEERARLWGWKPREEFNGKADKWVPADQFVARGLTLPAVLKETNTRLEDSLRHTQTELRTLQQQFHDQGTSLVEVTKMLRNRDAREYEGAKRHLQRRQAEAEASGDMEGFKQATTELAELEKNPPAAPETKGTEGAGSAGAQPGGGAQPGTKTPEQDRAERDFVQRNPWYGKRDNVQQETEALYIYLQAARRDLSPEAQLKEVERRMKLLFPTETGAAAAGGGAGGGEGEGGGAAAVTGGGENSGGGGGNRNTRSRRDFDSMPKEAKVAYEKYRKQLEGKGEPLTKQEYAQYYFEQFPDDEAA